MGGEMIEERIAVETPGAAAKFRGVGQRQLELSLAIQKRGAH
jgi:hypothetical protein